MTVPSVYVVGGAGSGKSTFVARLLAHLGEIDPDELLELHTKRNARGNPVVLRGHRVGERGLYIGRMRENFPGTDGLDRASGYSGEEWLDNGGADSWAWLLGEGATLTTARWLGALRRNTDLLLVHLHVDPIIADLRFLARGSNQNPGWIQNTVTRAANQLALHQAEPDSLWVSADTADGSAWMFAYEMALGHLAKESSLEG